MNEGFLRHDGLCTRGRPSHRGTTRGTGDPTTHTSVRPRPLASAPRSPDALGPLRPEHRIGCAERRTRGIPAVRGGDRPSMWRRPGRGLPGAAGAAAAAALRRIPGFASAATPPCSISRRAPKAGHECPPHRAGDRTRRGSGAREPFGTLLDRLIRCCSLSRRRPASSHGALAAPAVGRFVASDASGWWVADPRAQLATLAGRGRGRVALAEPVARGLAGAAVGPAGRRRRGLARG